MNEENLIGAVVRLALEDLMADNMRTRVKAYLFLYRKYHSLMGYADLDANYLVKRFYDNLKPIEEIKRYLEEVQVQTETKKRKKEFIEELEEE